MEAVAINDRGQIGWGRLSNGDIRPFLLTPVRDKNDDTGDCGEDILVTQVGTANQAALAFRSPANPMMRLFGHRSMPWYRNVAVQPPAK
jgi:hypothetical protein